MAVVATPFYRLRTVCRLHWKSWNDEYVVFDETSGQTHQLSSVHAFVLHLLTENPHTQSPLVSALLLAIPSADAFTLTEQVQSVLRELESSGLVDVVLS